MNNKASLISAAGYSGPTKERTWKERMRKLEELGFIKIASGKHGDISCVLILNPHKVLKKLVKEPGFDDQIYNCILEQFADYGMLDFIEPEPLVAPAATVTPTVPKRTKVPPPPPRDPGVDGKRKLPNIGAGERGETVAH
jgi:hypothetical protein